MTKRNCRLQELIDLWLMTIEQRFTLGTPGESAKTIYGDEFVELINSKDGEFILTTESSCTQFETAEEAWIGLKESFELYAEGREGKLFWRILPEVAKCTDIDLDPLSPRYNQHLGPDYYRGYMRLFIEEVKK